MVYFISGHRDLTKEEKTEFKSVIEILSSVYGTDNTLENMRNNEIPDMDLIPENNVKVHTRQGVDVHFDTRACVAV